MLTPTGDVQRWPDVEDGLLPGDPVLRVGRLVAQLRAEDQGGELKLVASFYGRYFRRVCWKASRYNIIRKEGSAVG